MGPNSRDAGFPTFTDALSSYTELLLEVRLTNPLCFKRYGMLLHVHSTRA